MRYRRIVPMLLLLFHLALLFQLQQQTFRGVSAGSSSSPTSALQWADIYVNLPAFLAALFAAQVLHHQSRLFVFYAASPIIPVVWYAICLVKNAKAPASSSLLWKITRRSMGAVAVLVFFLVLLFLSGSKDHRTASWRFGIATMLWFGALAVASFWSRPHESTPINLQEERHLETALAEPSAGKPRVARMGDRIVAAFLDGALMLPIFAALANLAAYRYRISPDANGTINLKGGPALFVMFFSTVLWCVYYFLAEWLSGRTFGKAVMAIEVLASDGERCGSRRAFVRNLFRPVDAFGFYLVGFVAALLSPFNQSIGDRTAGTIVRENPLARRKAAFLAYLLAFAALAAGSYTVGLLLQHHISRIN